MPQGIDPRGDGGHIVAAPSIHPGGKPYIWAQGRSPEETFLSPVPRWQLSPTDAARPGHSLADSRRLVREGVPAGRRNYSIASLTGHLLRHGVDPHVAIELLLAWNSMRCQPPLGHADVAGVVENIARIHQKEEARRGH